MSEAVLHFNGREKPGWLGPAFFRELVRQTRKGRGYFARLLYGSLLLCMLFVVFGQQEEVTQKNVAYLSEWAAQAYLVMQFLAVIVLTPIFVAGSFIEERQQRTLELLLTTNITARELVLGKLVSRLIHVMAVLVAGLPVLAILQFLGGVNIAMVLWLTFLTFITMIICGMYAIRASTLSKTQGGAIFSTYMMMVGGAFACVPLFSLLIPLCGYFFRPYGASDGLLSAILIISPLLLNLLFGVLSLRGAIAAVVKESGFGTDLTFFDTEHIRTQSPIVVRESQSAPGKRSRGQAESIREHRTERWIPVPPVSDHPLLWKEMYFPLANVGPGLTVLCCGYPLFLLLIGAAEHSAKSMSGPLLSFLFWAVKGNMMLLLFMSTLKAAGTFNQERLRQTMSALFTLPMSHLDILAQKGLGSVMRYRSFLLHTYLLMLTYLIYSPGSFAPISAIYTAQLGFFVIIGLFLSLLPLPAHVAKMVICAYFFWAGLALPMILDQTGLRSWLSFGGFVLLFVTSPYSAWSYGVMPEQDTVQHASLAIPTENTVVILLVTTVVLLLLSALLLVLSAQMLRRWQERWT
jgi:ABC-type transport system involved in multi-copper enzyme maturation permease subunit